MADVNKNLFIAPSDLQTPPHPTAGAVLSWPDVCILQEGTLRAERDRGGGPLPRCWGGSSLRTAHQPGPGKEHLCGYSPSTRPWTHHGEGLLHPSLVGGTTPFHNYSLEPLGVEDLPYEAGQLGGEPQSPAPQASQAPPRPSTSCHLHKSPRTGQDLHSHGQRGAALVTRTKRRTQPKLEGWQVERWLPVGRWEDGELHV